LKSEEVNKQQNKISLKRKLILGEDYYINADQNWVFTAEYHLKRGYCCENKCKHCPYQNWSK
jgi:hypothetical protein